MALRDLQLVTRLPDGLQRMPADPRLLTELRATLLTCAMNYAEAGGKVTVSAALQVRSAGWGVSHVPAGSDAEDSVPRPRQWLTLSVADTGPGISDEELPHIFERFFRSQSARQGAVPGTGLGLAIAQEVIGQHGGRIWVDTEVGRCSTFTPWLPSDRERC